MVSHPTVSTGQTKGKCEKPFTFPGNKGLILVAKKKKFVNFLLGILQTVYKRSNTFTNGLI